MSRLPDYSLPAACDADVLGTLSTHGLQLAAGSPAALADWNNLHNDDRELVNLRYAGGTSDEDPAADLEDVLWGYAKLWPAPILEKWRTNIGRFRDSLQVDEWHAEVAPEEIIDHKFLHPEEQVEQYVFSNGKSVIANVSHSPWKHEGQLIEPEQYVIQK